MKLGWPIPDQADDAADADAEGLADIEAGRVVPHVEVEAWLRTWGTSDEVGPPAEWFR